MLFFESTKVKIQISITVDGVEVDSLTPVPKVIIKNNDTGQYWNGTGFQAGIFENSLSYDSDMKFWKYEPILLTLIGNYSYVIISTDTFYLFRESNDFIISFGSQIWATDISVITSENSAGEQLTTTRKLGTNKVIITDEGDGSQTIVVYDDDGTTPIHTYSLSADKLIRLPV